MPGIVFDQYIKPIYESRSKTLTLHLYVYRRRIKYLIKQIGRKF